MSTVTSQHINSVYDAINMTGIASLILSDGDVDDRLACEISWTRSSLCRRAFG